MKKGEILAMSDMDLIIQLTSVERQMVNGAGKVTGVLKKELKWTLEEICKRFEFDLWEMAEKMDSGHLVFNDYWERKEQMEKEGK